MVAPRFRIGVNSAIAPPTDASLSPPAPDFLRNTRIFDITEASESLVVNNVMDAVGSNDGAMVVYTSCADFGVSARWKLNLAYCDRECAGAENWSVSVVASDTDPSASCIVTDTH